MRDVEVDEGNWEIILENTIARTGVTVADDFSRPSPVKIERCVMQSPKQGCGRGQLTLREVP
jgi:hypothetical protein